MNKLRLFLLITSILTTVLVAFRAVRHLSRVRASATKPDRFLVFATLTYLNFVAFWWLSVLAGGDAMNGKIEGDHYFLGAYGRYTLVSFRFWLYSLIHESVTLATFLVSFAGMFVRIFTGKVEIPGDAGKIHPPGRGTV